MLFATNPGERRCAWPWLLPARHRIRHRLARIRDQPTGRQGHRHLAQPSARHSGQADQGYGRL